MYFPGILTANVGGKDRKNRKKVRVSSLFLDLICAPLFAQCPECMYYHQDP